MALRAETTSNGVIITVKVVPNASRAALAGLLGDALKIKVTKPPERGQANGAVVALLAKALNIAPLRVTVLAGHAQPLKKILITGLAVSTVQRLLLAAIESAKKRG